MRQATDPPVMGPEGHVRAVYCRQTSYVDKEGRKRAKESSLKEQLGWTPTVHTTSQGQG